MANDKRDAAVVVRLAPAIRRRVLRQAKRDGATTSDVVRAALVEYLDRREAERK